MDKSRFGELVRKAREDKGLKAFELADLMHTHGSQISRLENGTFKETPAPDVLAQLSEHLGLDQRGMLVALGYLPDEAESAGRIDPTATRLCAAVDAVDWSGEPNLAETFIEIMRGVAYRQQHGRQPGARTISAQGLGSGH